MMLRKQLDKKKSFLALFSLVFCLFPSISKCCSPPIGPIEPETAERTVYYADAVVLGTVLRHISDNQNLPTLFTAEMELSCIFKGGALPRYFNITGAGHNPGMCFANTLSVGKSYVVYLSKHGPSYTPSAEEVEVTGPNDPFMQNITRVCDLKTIYPDGTNPAQADCPQTMLEPSCVRYQESSIETTLPPTTTDTLKEFTRPQDEKTVKNSVAGTGEQSNNGASSKATEILTITLLFGILTIML